ncbi:MAG: M56 family metallopeptidase [Gemmatimonadota bacterium]|jgi:beta-lactamase regulating signal transducer with metallopeptidase domain
MIAYRMLYAVVVALPVLGASFGVAAVLRRHGKPERWIWLVGLVLSFALPTLYLSTSLARVPSALTESSIPRDDAVAPDTDDGPAFMRFTSVIRVPRADVGFGLDEVLLAVWMLVSGGLALRWLVSGRRLVRLTRSWQRDAVDGTEVWLTPTSGPAVAGVLRSRILVPRWLLDLPEEQRTLVLLHEREHVRARDPWLMAVTRVARILAPWNPVVWALSSRLLRAVEMDCDRRVLWQRPDVRAYCDTLLAISARQPSRLIGAAAFAEPRVPLQKRIIAMTAPARSISVVGATLVLALGALLVVGSCSVPVPTERDADSSQGVVPVPVPNRITVAIAVDGEVTIDGQVTSWDDATDVLAARAAAATGPVVARIHAPDDVPYRHIERLQRALVEAGVIRVAIMVRESGDQLHLVLPETTAGAEQSQMDERNVLELTVQPTGRVDVRRGASTEVESVEPRALTSIWLDDVAENPRLIAAVRYDPGATYAHVRATLGVLEGVAARIALFGDPAG